MGVQLAVEETTVPCHAFRAAHRHAAIRRREQLVAECKQKSAMLEKEVLQWHEWHSQNFQPKHLRKQELAPMCATMPHVQEVGTQTELCMNPKEAESKYTEQDLEKAADAAAARTAEMVQNPLEARFIEALRTVTVERDDLRRLSEELSRKLADVSGHSSKEDSEHEDGSEDARDLTDGYEAAHGPCGITYGSKPGACHFEDVGLARNELGCFVRFGSECVDWDRSIPDEPLLQELCDQQKHGYWRCCMCRGDLLDRSGNHGKVFMQSHFG